MLSKIVSLRSSLELSQAAFGKLFGVTAMTVSRWENGKIKPGSSQLLVMGKIVGKRGGGWYFWNQAGITRKDIQSFLK